MPTKRIIGFDLARAYAIFGMFIVNFNFCFGSFGDGSPVGQFLRLFTGNSTSIFILSAGMGVSLMTNRADYNEGEKKLLKSIILKRSWFLFGLGLLLYPWWPGDILHFYGGYMHIAAFILFVPKRYYLWTALAAILVFHLLLFVIPIDTSWNFETFQYADFWTPLGFLRNTLYNGWNSVFPWLAYFVVGMWLGRLDWQSNIVKRNIFLIGLVVLLIFEGLRALVKAGYLSQFWSYYIMSDYFPPYLPFMLITTGFAFMVISICMFLGERFANHNIINALVKTGQMTLSHYVIHLTLGMIIFGLITRKHYTGLLEDEMPTPPIQILAFAFTFFVLSVLFSVLWRKRFKNGPLEMIMRKLSD
jgi:uncharacterized protein